MAPKKKIGKASAEPMWKRHLRQVLEERGISMREASLRAGSNEEVVRTLLSRPISPNLDTLYRICEGNNIDPQWLQFGKVSGSDVLRVPMVAPENTAAMLKGEVSGIVGYEVVSAEHEATRFATFGWAMQNDGMWPPVMQGSRVLFSAALDPLRGDIVAVQVGNLFLVRRYSPLVRAGKVAAIELHAEGAPEIRVMVRQLKVLGVAWRIVHDPKVKVM